MKTKSRDDFRGFSFRDFTFFLHSVVINSLIERRERNILFTILLRKSQLFNLIFFWV